MKYDRKKLIDRKDEELSAKNYYSIAWNKYKLTIPRCNYLSIDLELIEIQTRRIGLATKWLRVLSIPPNDKTRNHLVANPIRRVWISINSKSMLR